MGQIDYTHIFQFNTEVELDGHLSIITTCREIVTANLHKSRNSNSDSLVSFSAVQVDSKLTIRQIQNDW